MYFVAGGRYSTGSERRAGPGSPNLSDLSLSFKIKSSIESENENENESGDAKSMALLRPNTTYRATGPAQDPPTNLKFVLKVNDARESTGSDSSLSTADATLAKRPKLDPTFSSKPSHHQLVNIVGPPTSQPSALQPPVSSSQVSKEVLVPAKDGVSIANGKRQHPHQPIDAQDPGDVEDGQYKLVFGTSIGSEEEQKQDQYVLKSLYGKGTFGNVVCCYDTETQKTVAIKILRDTKLAKDIGMAEIDIFFEIDNSESPGAAFIVKLLDFFEFPRHLCLVFEALGTSFFDFLKGNKYQGFQIDGIREIARQTLLGLDFLHQIGYTHTDIKPENLMLVYGDYTTTTYHCETTGKQVSYRIPKSYAMKIIDLGSATKLSQPHSKIVSTRHYRAIEVILDLGWSFPCDVWSLGCVLFELYTGRILFRTHEDHEHLALMDRVLGPVPSKMFAHSPHKRRFAALRNLHPRQKVSGHPEMEYRLVWPTPSATKESIHFVEKTTQSLNGYMTHQATVEAAQKQRTLFRLMRSLLSYDPAQRPTPSETLKTEFFSLAF